MEELKVKGIDELCEWFGGQPEMKGKSDILEPAQKVINEQKSMEMPSSLVLKKTGCLLVFL